MFELENIVRENIKQMTPYSSARHEFTGKANVFLDANENAFGSPLPENYNRYPDPLQSTLKEKLSTIKNVPAQNIFLGNGSDEAIDLLFRIFCEPAIDNVIILPPTYGMYQVCADINKVAIKQVLLTIDFQIDLPAVEKAIDANTKLIFICSPNNPTGNTINKRSIYSLLTTFNGLVVIDEAYIDYSTKGSFSTSLNDYPNLIILQTLSKAWGLAGLRLGMAFASENIINYFNKVKYPYNINTVTQQLVLNALLNQRIMQEWATTTIQQREWLSQQLTVLPFTKIIYPSDANFLLVKMAGAKKIYDHLCTKGIIVRDRSKVILCDDCLRITVGSPEENIILMNELNNYTA